MTDWSADPWFAQHAWVAPRVGEPRRSGFKSLRPHSTSNGRRKRTAKLQNPTQESNPRGRIDEGFLWSSKMDGIEATPMSSPIAESPVHSRCDHSEVEDLGSAGIVEFYRCTRCRDVVVVQGSRRWAVTAILED